MDASSLDLNKSLLAPRVKVKERRIGYRNTPADKGYRGMGPRGLWQERELQRA